MANADAAYGFRPVMNKGGGTPVTDNFAPQGYSIASGYASTIALGDPVGSTGTASADGRPGIQLVSTPGVILGVFGGCEYTNSLGERVFSHYWPASTAATNIIAHVYDDPDTIFSIQGDEDIEAADFHNKVDYIHAASVNGVSRVELDSSNIGTGDALLILCRDDSVSPNDIASGSAGNFAKVLVMIREHEMLSAYTAV